MARAQLAATVESGSAASIHALLRDEVSHMIIRGTALLALFRPRTWHLFAASIGIMAVIPTVIAYRTFAPFERAWDRGGWIAVPIALSAAVVVTVTQNYWRQRLVLREAEHFVALAALAVLASILQSVLQYAIFRSDRDEYVLDVDVQTRVLALEARTFDARQAAASSLAAALLKLSDQVAASPSQRLAVMKRGGLVEHISSMILERELFTVGLNAPYRLEFEKRVNTENGAEAWFLNVQVGSEELDLLEAKSDPEAWRWIEWRSNAPASVDSIGLARALLKRALYERDRATSLAAFARTVPPLSLFLYSGAMQSLQSDPSYIKPIGDVAQCLSLAFTALRFLYFGLFVAVIARRWAVDVAQ